MNAVGRYRIEGEIGRGAMGVVYKALDPAIGRTVAIKTIHLPDALAGAAGPQSEPPRGSALVESETQRRVTAQLFREAQAAGTLSHPSIVTVFDVLEQEEFAYIVMEYVAGPSLDELMRLGRLPEREQVMQYLRQIAEALDYAHRKGIIHRDIKPANILIADGGTLAKITDFGIAKTISVDATHAGGVIGTPSYMSPEQIEGLQLDGRSDQFSLAVLLYELLTGRKPFAAETVPALLHQICHEAPATVESLNPALSATVGKVLQRALAKKPADRFATASDFIGAISIALAESFYASGRVETRRLEQGEMPAPPLSGAPTRIRATAVAEAERPRRSRTLPLIVVLCFAVAAAIVFIVRLNSSSQVPVQVLETRSAPESPPPASTPAPQPTATRASPKLPSPPPEAPASKPPTSAAPAPESANRSEPVSHSRGVIVPAIPATDAGVSTADVDLVTEPAGARVAVDGRADAICSAPCTMALPTGRHTLIAELNGYATARRIFVLPETRRLYIPLAQSTGLLVLTSEPSGAGITVDGRPFGITPATLHLTAGIHHIVVARGLQHHEEAVNIEPGSFLTRAIKW